MSPPSSRLPVLILSGGPAGSTAAPLLARDGIETTVIEREVFPRYHIGESLLPSCLEIADLIGARELMEKEGFQRKPGAYLEWRRETWSLDFGELRGRHTCSFQVERSRFDHLLLQHARSQGAAVHEEVEVQSLDFDETGRPCRAHWVRRGDPVVSGTIAFDYFIDASGRNGIMVSRYLWVLLAILSALLGAAPVASLLRGKVSEPQALSLFEKSYRQAYLRFLVFVSVLCDQGRGKESYFSEAQSLSHYEVERQGLRPAFLNLASGIEDMFDAGAVTEHLMGDMSRKVGENLRMRQDEVAMAQAGAEQRELQEKNAAFFDHVEGLGALEVAIDGLYGMVQPRLGLSHTQAGVSQAA